MTRKILIFAFIVIISSSCANQLFFHPDKNVYKRFNPEKYNYEEVYFKSSDNTKLHGFFIRPEKKPEGTIIHFHGNAQNLTSHFGFVEWVPDYNFNLFVFDYRGYGKSEGSPDRKGLYEDCIAAVEFIKQKKDKNSENIFLLGQSLGGAYALSILEKYDEKTIKAVAADSAFYSFRQITADKIKLIPLLSLFRKPLSYIMATDTKSPEHVLGKINGIPLLVLHGKKDRIVPFSHGAYIFKNAASEKKRFEIIEDGRHTDAFITHGKKYKTIVSEFFINSLKKENFNHLK